VAAKMRRLNLCQEDDDRCSAESVIIYFGVAVGDLLYASGRKSIVKRLRLEVVVRQIQQTTTSRLEIETGWN